MSNEHKKVHLKAVSPMDEPPKSPHEPRIERPSFVTHDDWFSIDGRKMRPGLYWHSMTNPRGETPPEPVDTWVCSPIHAAAMTEDDRGSEHGLLLRFIAPRGAWREWAAPMRLLKGSAEELRGELLDQGVRIDPRARNLLAQWIMAQYPRKRITAATRTGWHGKAFVLPGRTIGDNHIKFQSESAVHDDFVAAGTMANWQANVAARCVGNPILMLAVSTAFAGPMLKIAKLQEVGGAGIHLVGRTSRGKTSALQAAASVWGAPGFVRTWRATGNGLEATAAALNDTLMVLDEISECDPREVGAIVYCIANGSGKQRASRTGGSRAAKRWRLMALSSGERTLSAHIAEAGRRVKAGMEVRLLDVPATERTYGAFDHLHGHKNGSAFADAVKQAAGADYGHAGPAFVTALIADSRDLPGLYALTCAQPVFASTEGAQARGAGVFALIGMAGELATEAGITGWLEGDALAAATGAYQAWLQHRGGGQAEDRQILQSVRDFILLHGDSRFSELSDFDSLRDRPVRDRAGYWRDDSDGRTYLFNSPALREAVAGHDLTSALDTLDRAGWIVERDTGRRNKRVKVAGTVVPLYAIRPEGEE